MDAADEAGGETIFCSDGMDPLPIPKVPAVVPSSENVYEILETDTPLVAPSNSALGGGESPEERLTRLAREVEALKLEMNDNEEVSKLARDLSSRLYSSSSFSIAQNDLVRAIQERTQKEGDSQESGVVYELYGGTVPASSSVEQRVLQMERLVGAASCNSSILERMERLENLANRVDEKALEEAATRAKVIRYVV